MKTSSMISVALRVLSRRVDVCTLARVTFAFTNQLLDCRQN
jgi:hypothetical protein